MVHCRLCERTHRRLRDNPRAGRAPWVLRRVSQETRVGDNKASSIKYLTMPVPGSCNALTRPVKHISPSCETDSPDLLSAALRRGKSVTRPEILCWRRPNKLWPLRDVSPARVRDGELARHRGQRGRFLHSGQDGAGASSRVPIVSRRILRPFQRSAQARESVRSGEGHDGMQSCGRHVGSDTRAHVRAAPVLDRSSCPEAALQDR
jgi:hypothetical protein